MQTEKTWDEFRASGMLWLVNTIIHVFGWSIVTAYEHGKFLRAYPVRCTYRGFTRSDTEDGYKQVAEYMVKEGGTILQEQL